jgi:hypothetical protein
LRWLLLKTKELADIFEALTAKDRPYKRGKTLTESLTILGKFKLGGHIGPDLFSDGNADKLMDNPDLTRI